MDKKTIIYSSIGILLALASCSQENPAYVVPDADGRSIYFRSYLPSVAQSRASVASSDNFDYCRATCFNPDDDNLIDPSTGEMTPYFTDIRFVKDDNGRFRTQGPDSCMWPDSQSRLHFLAYHPSITEMNHTGSDDYFRLVNASTSKEGLPTFDFRLERFRVASDIADQSDFLTAYASGSMTQNANSGIALEFRHQMARVELSAGSGNEKYDFEIAGVRIGNAVTGGDFRFPASAGDEYPWSATEGQKGVVEHIFTAGESIVTLSKQAGIHATDNDAASVMGNAGPAMVIPMQHRFEAWEGNGDPMIGQTPYRTDKMYFSLLVRVKGSDGDVVYPYPNDKDNIPVVYLAVEDEKINRRLYESSGRFYTDESLDGSKLYSPKDTERILGFCWASLPVAAKWEAGKIYTYRLNYSAGIGWQDPSDPNPGDPIIERGPIPFEVTVEEWKAATDYDSDLQVPRR